MKIEILHFECCPNHPLTVERVMQVVHRLGVAADVREVELTQDDDPAAMKFIGSPTVLIDGQDIDPVQRAEAGYGFGCRTFGGAGVPPVEMIEQAVREASDDDGGDQDCCSPRAASEQVESKRDQSDRLSFWSTPDKLCPMRRRVKPRPGLAEEIGGPGTGEGSGRVAVSVGVACG